MAVQPMELWLPGNIDGPRYGLLLCTTTDRPFGPLFPSFEAANAFDDWVRQRHGKDPRDLSLDLESLAHEFLNPASCEWPDPTGHEGMLSYHRVKVPDRWPSERVVALCERCAKALDDRLGAGINADNEDAEIDIEEIQDWDA